VTTKLSDDRYSAPLPPVGSYAEVMLRHANGYGAHHEAPHVAFGGLAGMRVSPEKDVGGARRFCQYHFTFGAVATFAAACIEINCRRDATGGVGKLRVWWDATGADPSPFLADPAGFEANATYDGTTIKVDISALTTAAEVQTATEAALPTGFSVIGFEVVHEEPDKMHFYTPNSGSDMTAHISGTGVVMTVAELPAHEPACPAPLADEILFGGLALAHQLGPIVLPAVP
jgi:hypothetical protein